MKVHNPLDSHVFCYYILFSSWFLESACCEEPEADYVMHLKMLSAEWQPFCLGLSVINIWLSSC